MTSSWQLFKEFYKQKSKYVYFIFIFQLIVALALVIMFKPSGNKFYSDTGIITISGFSSFCLAMIGAIFGTSFIAEGILGILTTIKNEKISRSANWRLVPINESKYFLSNIVSSLIELIWLGVLEIISMVAFGLMALPGMQTSKWLGKMIHDIAVDVSVSNYFYLFEMVVLLCLIAIAWYLMISFLNFSSVAIVDFLPRVSSKFILFLVRLVTIIILLFLFSSVAMYFNDLFMNVMNWLTREASLEVLKMGDTILALLGFDVIIALIDIAIFSKFVEAKNIN